MIFNRKDLLRLILEQDSDTINLMDLIPDNTQVLNLDDSGEVVGGFHKIDKDKIAVIEKSEEINLSDSMHKHLEEIYNNAPVVPFTKPNKLLSDMHESISNRIDALNLKSEEDLVDRPACKVKSSEDREPITTSDLFSDSRPICKVGSSEFSLDTIPEYLRDMYESGYIRDLNYLKVLSTNMSYLDYLKLDEKKFLDKRLEWKIGKIVGYRGIGKGYHKYRYRDTFVNFCNSEKGGEFLQLCADKFGYYEYQDNVFNIITYMIRASVDYDKIIYSIIRNCNVDKFKTYGFKNINYIPLNYLIDLLNGIKTPSGMNILEMIRTGEALFEPIAELSARIDYLYKNHSDESMVFLVQPNYREIIERKQKYNLMRKLNSLRDNVSHQVRFKAVGMLGNENTVRHIKDLCEYTNSDLNKAISDMSYLNYVLNCARILSNKLFDEVGPKNRF